MSSTAAIVGFDVSGRRAKGSAGVPSGVVACSAGKGEAGGGGKRKERGASRLNNPAWKVAAILLARSGRSGHGR